MAHQHDDMTDARFVRSFTLMIGGFLVLGLVIALIANLIGGGLDRDLDAYYENERSGGVATRMAAVGTLNVGQAVAATEPAPAAAEGVSGESVYQSSCFACHGAGVAGAPKLGDTAAWSGRIAQGNEVLVEHAIKGFQGSTGMMPPKGGNVALSDEEVRAAVVYMVEQSQ